MGNNTIPIRSPRNLIDLNWFNIFRSVLGGDIYCRNTAAAIADQAGSLGDSEIQWLNAFMMTVKLMHSTYAITLDVPTLVASFALTLPPDYPETKRAVTLGAAGTIAASLIGRSVFSPVNYAISASSGAYTSAGSEDVPNLSVEFTSDFPFIATLIPDGSGNAAYLDDNLTLTDNTTSFSVSLNSSGLPPDRKAPGALFYSGSSYSTTGTIKVQAVSVAQVYYCKLIAISLG